MEELDNRSRVVLHKCYIQKQTVKRDELGVPRGARQAWLRGQLIAVDPKNLIQVMLAEEKESYHSCSLP